MLNVSTWMGRYRNRGIWIESLYLISLWLCMSWQLDKTRRYIGKRARMEKIEDGKERGWKRARMRAIGRMLNMTKNQDHDHSKGTSR